MGELIGYVAIGLLLLILINVLLVQAMLKNLAANYPISDRRGGE